VRLAEVQKLSMQVHFTSQAGKNVEMAEITLAPEN